MSSIGRKDVSPDARVAASAYESLGSGRIEAFAACGSAVELVERGFAGDVTLCLEENVSRVACRLEGDRFVAELIG